MEKRTLSIATCQFEVGGDVHQNLSHILRQIRKAKSGCADVVHFPECCLTGYGGIQLDSIKREDYEHLDPAIEKVKSLAGQLGIYVILGSHYFTSDSEKPRNGLLVINANGEIETRYDKRILTGTEGTMDHLYYHHGEKPIIFLLKGVKCGLVICHEWRYPEFYREYKRLGAEVIFHSWFDGGLNRKDFDTSGKDEGELIVGAVKGYAGNNYLWVSGSNISSRESCFPSFVAQPDGQIFNKAPRNKSYVLMSKIDLDQKFIDPSFYGRQRFL